MKPKITSVSIATVHGSLSVWLSDGERPPSICIFGLKGHSALLILPLDSDVNQGFAKGTKPTEELNRILFNYDREERKDILLVIRKAVKAIRPSAVRDEIHSSYTALTLVSPQEI